MNAILIDKLSQTLAGIHASLQAYMQVYNVVDCTLYSLRMTFLSSLWDAIYMYIYIKMRQ